MFELVNFGAKPKLRRNSDINRTDCAINSRLLSRTSKESPKPYAQSCGAVMRKKSEEDASIAVNSFVEDINDDLLVTSDGQDDIWADQQSDSFDYFMHFSGFGPQFWETDLATPGVSAAQQQASSVDGASCTTVTRTEEVFDNHTQAWEAPIHRSSEFCMDTSTWLKADQASKKRRRSLSSNKEIQPSSSLVPKKRKRKASSLFTEVDHKSALGRSFFSTLWHS